MTPKPPHISPHLVVPQLSRLSPSTLTQIPEGVRDHVKMLLSVTSTVRPDADQMTKVRSAFLPIVMGENLFDVSARFQHHSCKNTKIFASFSQIPFFDDVGAVTLQYIDSLFQRDNLQKSQFYKGLPKVLPKLPKVGTAVSLVRPSGCPI